jgi:hypothetical protein
MATRPARIGRTGEPPAMEATCDASVNQSLRFRARSAMNALSNVPPFGTSTCVTSNPSTIESVRSAAMPVSAAAKNTIAGWRPASTAPKRSATP